MKLSYLASFILLSFLFFGCDDMLGCVIPKEPRLDNKEFPIGSINTYYYVDLNADIRNEPDDNNYDYFFEVEGLPLGMDYFVNYRTISIEGLPVETGTFEITITVFVDGPIIDYSEEFPDALCNDTASKTYMLIIE